MYQYNNF